ncbi:class I SAM-dependent methyltransferase [Amycolatopsis tucumanensis]|uniref:Methyltransferase domain-containing protein n=1 Tax=Amycolatopsis tucumanensis TaxID=401106 RepID=A0ABP7HXF2_9PSEU|nr:class I SAM-dependent methyltransferase [Amycolatopsis tucumanensis]MCF6426883.1 class I SAM-dependent methyltransferase [Amycolatopsis tucumanensis]
MDATTADGSPVEVYRLLPPAGEAEIVHRAAPPGAAVLDLGCGTGRIAHRLAELGHPVTAVDDSPEMLAHVRGAETVQANIEDLDLERRFPVVLLASHLVNQPDSAALLATVARHLAGDGVALVEWHPPSWFDTVTEGGGRLGEVLVSLSGISRDGPLLSATVRYQARGRSWEQPFTARRLTESELRVRLAEAGLRFSRWCTPDHRWFAAKRTEVADSPRPEYGM